MTWQAFISSDAQILGGKPALKGPRLSVEFLLERLANGWSVQDLHDNYPGLTAAQVPAVFAFANELLADTRCYPAPPCAFWPTKTFLVTTGQIQIYTDAKSG